MFEVDVRLCCDWLCKLGMCISFFVDHRCLNLMSGYVVIVYVKLVCVIVLPFVMMRDA